MSGSEPRPNAAADSNANSDNGWPPPFHAPPPYGEGIPVSGGSNLLWPTWHPEWLTTPSAVSHPVDEWRRDPTQHPYWHCEWGVVAPHPSEVFDHDASRERAIQRVLIHPGAFPLSLLRFVCACVAQVDAEEYVRRDRHTHCCQLRTVEHPMYILTDVPTKDKLKIDPESLWDPHRLTVPVKRSLGDEIKETMDNCAREIEIDDEKIDEVSPIAPFSFLQRPTNIEDYLHATQSLVSQSIRRKQDRSTSQDVSYPPLPSAPGGIRQK